MIYYLYIFLKSHTQYVFTYIFCRFAHSFLAHFFVFFTVNVTTNFSMPVIYILWIFTISFCYCKKEQKKRSELFFINGVEKWENKCVFNGPIVNVVWNRCYKVCGMMMQFSCYPCRQWLDVKHNIEPNSIQMKRNLFHSEWMNGKNEFNHFIVLGRSENKAKKRKETVLLIGIDDVVFNWKSVFIWIGTHFESHS